MTELARRLVQQNRRSGVVGHPPQDGTDAALTDGVTMQGQDLLGAHHRHGHGWSDPRASAVHRPLAPHEPVEAALDDRLTGHSGTSWREHKVPQAIPRPWTPPGVQRAGTAGS
jgi:hypothetical protein